MKCLRCGYCCLQSFVVIVLDPKKGAVEGNLRAIDATKERCPHLRGGGPGEYGCAVHEESWYRGTPCFSHSQVERQDSDCRMGVYFTQGRVETEEARNGS